MTHTEAVGRVAELNCLLQSKPWLDVDVAECSPNAVVLDCGIDLSVGPNVQVHFESVFVVQLLMTWKTDTSAPVLRVLDGDEARRVNLLYQVEQGHHLFAFQPEDLGTGGHCLIVAKNFSWQEITRP